MAAAKEKPTKARVAKKTKGKAKVQNLTPDSLRKAMNDRFGADAIRMASDESLQITRLSTGILSVDDLLGGGMARGRSCEIFGSASVGKGYLAQMLVATTQQAGGRGAWIDGEKTFDPEFADSCGIDLDELAYHEQIHGPMCVDVMETLLRSRLYDVIVLDSIATLLPQADYENDMMAGSYGMEQAKLMSKGLRKLTAANESTVLLFINQTREAVGGMTFGKKTTTSGGRSMAFYASSRLELVKTETLKRKGTKVDHKTGDAKKDADVPYGHRVLVRAEKDKTGGITRPLDETTFVFDYERGCHDPVEDLLYVGRKYDLVGKSGNTWWVDEYEDEQKNGRPAFVKWLTKNKAVQEELEERIRERSEARHGEEEEAE